MRRSSMHMPVAKIIDKPSAGTKAGEEWSDNSLKMKFCWCPAGKFQMGGATGDLPEGPVHEVTLSSGLWMGKYEVTQSEYQKVMGQNSSYFDSGNDAASRPVESVSWSDADEFCRRFSTLERDADRLSENGEYRLPTEAEWEYACRAGTTTVWSFGNDENLLKEFAWYKKNSGNTTHSVGQKKPNAWGIHDMHGNIGEWCIDWFDSSYYRSSPAIDPRGPSSGSDRVLRGGSWLIQSRNARSADRNGYRPGYRYFGSGFRLVRVFGVQDL